MSNYSVDRNYSPYVCNESGAKKNSAVDLLTFDVGVIIALPEEFNLFMNYVQKSSGIYAELPIPEQFWSDDLAFWRFELRNGESVVQVVTYLVGEMGTEFTSVATNILVEKWKIPFIVNIGVTGSFSDELSVGSVLVPTQITHYTANWKAKDSSDFTETEYILGTRAFATNRLVLSQFDNYLTTAQYRQWQAFCEKDVSLPDQHPDHNKKHNIAFPKVHLGHLASGNMVVDSAHYKALIKKTDRKLMGCDMEAAGFAIAEQFLRAPVRVASQFLSLRCISDMAANKAEAESGALYITVGGEKIESREYAMRNATFLFLHLVKDKVINASTSAQLQQLQALMESLKARSKATQSRALKPANQSAAALLPNIKTQKDFKSLTVENQRCIIQHLREKHNDDSYYEDEDPVKVGIALMQKHGPLKRTYAAPATTESAKKSRLNEHTPISTAAASVSSEFHSNRSSVTRDLNSSEMDDASPRKEVLILKANLKELLKLVDEESLPAAEVHEMNETLSTWIERLRSGEWDDCA